ncbi:hypothetical protein KCU62_g132, partial [Aureobasidium sp. EXF-3399]
MKAPRYSASRQKACNNCTRGKTRCQKGPSGCSRCVQRGLLCIDPQDAMAQVSTASIDECVIGSYTGDESTILFDDTSRQANFDFSELRLACTINVDDITSRWLNTYVPVAGQVINDYPLSISALIRRVLKSYVASAVRGHTSLPPFIHPAQIDDSSSGSHRSRSPATGNVDDLPETNTMQSHGTLGYFPSLSGICDDLGSATGTGLYTLPASSDDEPPRSGLDDNSTRNPKRRTLTAGTGKVEQWMEDLDEFGMMIYAVTSSKAQPRLSSKRLSAPCKSRTHVFPVREDHGLACFKLNFPTLLVFARHQVWNLRDGNSCKSELSVRPV